MVFPVLIVMINCCVQIGNTPLHEAAQRPNHSILRFLLATSQCDVNCRNSVRVAARIALTRPMVNMAGFVCSLEKRRCMLLVQKEATLRC